MVMVLGGAGYIGSHMVYELVRRGERVVVVDNLQTGHREAVHGEATFYQGDVRDRAFMDGVFEREEIEAVIHFAANSLVGESMENPLKYYDNNLYGTLSLLQSMLAHDVKRIVFSSSAAVYGEPEHVPMRETDQTRPTNTYGETKLAMEKMMGWTEVASGLKYVALRYFNACGADASGEIGEDHKSETHLIPNILRVALGKREALKMFGSDYPTRDGTCVRDYVHVADLVAAHVLALEHLRKGGASDAFNLGSGTGFTNREIVEAARRVTNREIRVDEAPRRAGDPATLIASSEKAKTMLGWKPIHEDLDEIIESAWNWHRSHPEGFGA